MPKRTALHEQAPTPESTDFLNVIQIMCDQMPWYAMGCAGHPWIKTPNIDRLARTGVMCTNAWSQSPVCCPSRASQLSGLYPQNHGIMSNMHNLDVMNPNVRFLTDLFFRAGYQTSHFGKWHCLRRLEDACFSEKKFMEESIPVWPQHAIKEHWPQILDKPYVEYAGLVHAATHPFAETETGPARITDWTVDFVRRNASSPFLCRVSYLGPHAPVLVPEPYDTMYRPEDIELPDYLWEEIENRPDAVRQMVAHSISSRATSEHNVVPDMSPEMAIKTHIAYNLGSISHIDTQIGRILSCVEELGVRERTVILFTADHGGFWGEYGLLEKSNSALYRNLLQVPMIFSCPGTIPSGISLDGFVEVVDEYPTLLDFAGIENEFRNNGKSIKDALLRGGETGREEVFAQGVTYNGGPVTASIRTDEYAFVWWARTGECELYDRRNDPDERWNLAHNAEYADAIDAMKTRLLNRMMNAFDVHVMPDPSALTRSPIDLTPDQDFAAHQNACIANQLGNGPRQRDFALKPGRNSLHGRPLKEIRGRGG